MPRVTASPISPTHCRNLFALAAWVTLAVPVSAPAQVAHDPATDAVTVSTGLRILDVSARAPGAIALDLLIDTRQGSPRRIPMARIPAADDPAFRARVTLDGPVATYRFAGTRADGGAIDDPARHEARLDTTWPTPDWAKGAVWYQIFPERFRNANKANDPRGPAVFLADWSSDWYAVQPGEMESWRARRAMSPDAPIPDRTGGPLYHVIWDRRYGGDLQGVVEKLDELKDLGVTALYLNPIFEAESLHKYDASDFRHIDRNLADPGTPPPRDGTYTPPNGETLDPATWTWTPADRYFVDVFLPEVHRRGMRVVIDGVWNHVGRRFWAFQDVASRGRESPYAEWFQVAFDQEGRLESWVGWPDRKNGELPQFRQLDGNRPVPKFADLAPGPKRHVFDVTRRWMDPNADGDPSDGIDGWRLDVAAEIGPKFWREWHALVRSINPNALTICEVWEPADKVMKPDLFTTQMHYPFAFGAVQWLTGLSTTRAPYGATDLARDLAHAFNEPPQVNLVHQNLLASHDTDRFVNMLWNPGRGYDRDCAVQNGDDTRHAYKPGRPPSDIYERSILAAALQATYEGAPMVYYGDEYGMWGADDPTCRKPTPWPDLAIPDERAHDRADPALRARWRAWLTLRSDPRVGPTLRLGMLATLDSGLPGVLAFERRLDETRVLVAINRDAPEYESSRLWPELGKEHALKPGEARVWLVTPGAGPTLIHADPARP